MWCKAMVQKLPWRALLLQVGLAVLMQVPRFWAVHRFFWGLTFLVDLRLLARWLDLSWEGILQATLPPS